MNPVGLPMAHGGKTAGIRLRRVAYEHVSLVAHQFGCGARWHRKHTREDGRGSFIWCMLPKISRATSVVVARQRWNRLSSGRELNSATKLITHPPRELMLRCGWTNAR